MPFNLFSGLLGLVICVLDVWAIASIINSDRDTGTKVLWILVVAILPVLGLILWWFAGPKANYQQR